MRRSSDRILTTHVGNLPESIRLDPASADYDADLRKAVADVVARQRRIGIDIVNDGEYTKAGDWLSYVNDRFGGYEERPRSDGKPMILRGGDRDQFGDFYKSAFERGTLFYMPDMSRAPRHPNWFGTGPVTYKGQAGTARETAVLTDAVRGSEAFLTATSPASLEVYRENGHYTSDEEHVFAIAEAMREEYEAIATSGLLLQIDDAWLLALWERLGPELGLDGFRKRCAVRIEALNHALANIPEDRIRYHMCWGSWHGAHAHDIEFRHVVDLLLRVKAQAYLIESSSARHGHEYAVWETVKLPEGKILVPGVVSHATDGIEHPELVSQRIQRFARLVGRENVIAGADCGFGARTHPQIAWAKLQAIVDGARLASKALWN